LRAVQYEGKFRRPGGSLRIIRICLATLGSASLAACAPLAPYNPDRLPMQQMSRIGEICRVVMGLPAGPITQYLACEESLSHSLAARRDRGPMLAAHHACEAQGLKPNTAALAECELNQTDFAPGGAAALPAKAPKSYFSASNDEVHRREQEACAQIGYDPIGGGSAFAQCVADLQSNLFDADNPRWVP
jgi:hypothetical protein